jgi:lactate dehydrogenase-like 2-hydroxyacid dehydrogenase
MKKRILVTFNMFREGFAELEGRYDVTFPAAPDGNFTHDEALALIADYDALCPMFDFPVNRELLSRAGERLKIVANYAVGYDNIDVAYAHSKGITVANTPDETTEPTANLALSLLLNAARRVSEFDRRLRAEGARLTLGVAQNLGLPVAGATLGIIGMGRIGKALCRRARACQMNVIYYCRHRLDPDEEKMLGVTYVVENQLLTQSDFVSLNAPLTPETFHIIGAAELRLMKPTAILINTARGALVDEKALVAALQNRQIYGAGLDVFEFGQCPPPELLAMDNVVLTPHFGTQTMFSRIAMAKAVSNNVIGFFENDREVRRVK